MLNKLTDEEVTIIRASGVEAESSQNFVPVRGREFEEPFADSVPQLISTKDENVPTPVVDAVHQPKEGYRVGYGDTLDECLEASRWETKTETMTDDFWDISVQRVHEQQGIKDHHGVSQNEAATVPIVWGNPRDAEAIDVRWQQSDRSLPDEERSRSKASNFWSETDECVDVKSTEAGPTLPYGSLNANGCSYNLPNNSGSTSAADNHCVTAADVINGVRVGSSIDGTGACLAVAVSQTQQTVMQTSSNNDVRFQDLLQTQQVQLDRIEHKLDFILKTLDNLHVCDTTQPYAGANRKKEKYGDAHALLAARLAGVGTPTSEPRRTSPELLKAIDQKREREQREERQQQEELRRREEERLAAEQQKRKEIETRRKNLISSLTTAFPEEPESGNRQKAGLFNVARDAEKKGGILFD